MIDPLESSKYSVRHARRHIDCLKKSFAGFFASNPYTIGPEIDPQTGETVYKLKLIGSFPDEWPGMLFDSINSLRAALDQAGFAIAIANGKSGRDAKFPFADELDNILSRRQAGEFKQIPEAMFNFMLTYKPCKAGNYDLWAINKLCNSQKHEVILSLQSQVTPRRARVMQKFRSDFRPNADGKPTIGSSAINLSPSWDAKKNEMTLVKFPQSAKVDIKIHIVPDVTVEKIGVVKPLPALAFLDKASSIVDDILLGIEAEGKRLTLWS
jgi:hypothetical protein